jgi:hypothetical protein
MTLNTLAFRAASLLAAATVSLVAVYGQTTYSSPVRVTNTPLPVSGAVTVTPAAGSMPVVQQGTVTVAPAGGTMPVGGTVALSGTPAVTLSGVANQVRLAGTPFSLYGIAQLPDGVMFSNIAVGAFPAGSLVEVEFATMRCGFEPPGRLWVAEISVAFGAERYQMPMTFYMTRLANGITQEWYHGATPVKIYAAGGSQLYVNMQRSTGDTGYARCTVSVSGRSY